MQEGIVLATLVKLGLASGGSSLSFRFCTDAVEFDGRLPFGQSRVKRPSFLLLKRTPLCLYRVKEYLPRVTLGVTRHKTIIGLVKSIFAMKIDIIARGQIMVKAG